MHQRIVKPYSSRELTKLYCICFNVTKSIGRSGVDDRQPSGGLLIGLARLVHCSTLDEPHTAILRVAHAHPFYGNFEEDPLTMQLRLQITYSSLKPWCLLTDMEHGIHRRKHRHGRVCTNGHAEQ